MPCFGCHTNSHSHDIPLQEKDSFHSSLYSEAISEIPGGFQRHAAKVQLQMELMRQLSPETYGIALDNDLPGMKYDVQDFFTFKEILGSGNTCVVFRAIFKPTQETFAVKFIPNFKTFAKEVIRELQVLNLSDKCRELIGFHSHFRVDNHLYFVLHLCEGGTLQSLLDTSRHVMPPRLSRVYLKQLSNALFFLHSYKVVHRDVTLHNCMITGRGQLRLGDFGLCRSVDDPVQGICMTVCGHPSIRAPEVYLAKGCGFGVDWWSVGVLLYRFIAGCFPFNVEKPNLTYQAVINLNETYPEWRFFDPDSRDLCQKFLQKDPQNRLGYVNEVTKIKAHPFFFGVDWLGEDDIEHVIGLDMKADKKNLYIPVLKNMCTIMGLSIPYLANKSAVGIASAPSKKYTRITKTRNGTVALTVSRPPQPPSLETSID